MKAADSKKHWKSLRLPAAAALLAVLVVAGVYYARRPRFDMVKTLAGFVANEGVWDNQWDKTKEKLAELQTALATEKDPSRRFALMRPSRVESASARSFGT